MPDYQQSKIYKIINHELPNLVYYGSTTQPLTRRFSKHKDASKTRNGSSKIMFRVGSPEIILLEYYPCETKAELLKRERVWIKGNECINHAIPGRTDAEYYQDNKEKKIEQSKQYNQDNKEKILEYFKQWKLDNKEKINEKFNCECGGKYTQANKSGHLKTKKHIKFISSNQSSVDVVDGHQN
tara:strand:- start:164 stop:712 length:549 start_codon:yes stop_codon:yes gene_type:complete